MGPHHYFEVYQIHCLHLPCYISSQFFLDLEFKKSLISKMKSIKCSFEHFSCVSSSSSTTSPSSFFLCSESAVSSSSISLFPFSLPLVSVFLPSSESLSMLLPPSLSLPTLSPPSLTLPTLY